MNNKINSLRKKLDRIDNKIIKLLEKRFKIAQRVGETKKQNGFEISDKEREKQIVEEKIKKSQLDKKFIRDFYKLIFKQSKEVQKR